MFFKLFLATDLQGNFRIVFLKLIIIIIIKKKPRQSQLHA